MQASVQPPCAEIPPGDKSCFAPSNLYFETIRKYE